jgi:hypothetical protein
MSDQLKLSKLFYVNPRLLPHHLTHANSQPPTFNQTPPYEHLKNDIFTNGFDPERPIIVRTTVAHSTLIELPRFPSVTSIVKLNATHIEDGNHRLAIALELKLNYVPVRFQFREL